MSNAITSFLFSNTSVRQTIFKNTFWITLSAGICKALRAVLIIYLARALGPTDYGKFAFALAFISLFVSFFDMGVPIIATREFSKEGAKREEFNSLISLKIVLGIATVILIFSLSLFITSSPEIQRLIWILTLASFFGQFPEIFYSLFRSKEKMEYEAFINVFQVLLLSGIIFFVILNFLSPKNISFGYLIANLITLIVAGAFFCRKFAPIKGLVDVKIWKRFLVMAWPLALTSIFGMIYGYFDSAFLGYSNQVKETGLYNAALRIINIAVLPSGIITMTFYPVLSRLSCEKEKTSFQKLFNYQMKILMAIAVFLILIGVVFAPQIISLIYGPSYLPAVSAFRVLLATTGISYLLASFSQIFIIFNKQWKYFWVTFWGAIINVILDLVLIPAFSLYGAAVASFFATFLMLVLSLFYIYKNIPVKIFSYKNNRLFI